MARRNNENALTELAAETSLHPISCFAVRGAGTGGPLIGTPLVLSHCQADGLPHRQPVALNTSATL